MDAASWAVAPPSASVAELDCAAASAKLRRRADPPALREKTGLEKSDDDAGERGQSFGLSPRARHKRAHLSAAASEGSMAGSDWPALLRASPMCAREGTMSGARERMEAGDCRASAKARRAAAAQADRSTRAIAEASLGPERSSVPEQVQNEGTERRT